MAKLFISEQTFYERITGIPHKITLWFDWRGRKCYDIHYDGEFYATAEHKCGAYDEMVDIVKTNNLRAIKPY